MSKRTLLPCVFPVVASAFVGCGSFGKDRALDFAQTFDVAGGFSEGLDLNLRATKAVQIGLGGYRGVHWYGLKDGVFDDWMEERSELGIGPFYQLEVFRDRGSKLLDIEHPLFGDAGFRERSWDIQHYTDRGWFDFGITMNAALIGVDFAFKGEEFADFCAGFFGKDFLNDDVYEPDLDTIVNRMNSDDARIRAGGARALLLRTGDDYGYAIYTAPLEFPLRQQMAVKKIREELGGKTAPPPAVETSSTSGDSKP